ncbi:MAG: ATP-binding protein [Chloroflexota bacterium]|jgi:MinD superfamily P-loop ATPase
MIVTVASGKGGTGKTTVATALATAVASLQQETAGDASKVMLLDCDVEEPNAHLYLDPVFEKSQEVGVPIPVVDYERCDFCRRCAEVCAYHAIAVLGKEVLVFPELCHGCGSCTLNCPKGAISEQLRATGVIEEGKAGSLRFAQGVLNVGEAMGVPVIRQLKKRLSEVSQDSLVILDAPPGTSCPVVECLHGSDYALMVTEPTPFGLHDLKMAVEVARDKLNLKVGVIINRDGVGDDKVDEYCREEAIPVLMRIPLDRRIAEACSRGLPLPVAMPDYRQPFIDLHRRIQQEVEQ